ncbi:ABC transporter permease [Brevibacterium sp. GP-SGM9]|uniref:ABC transporter permease n=1 Tax=unclassified Brevibacterium TaxID=2614124 RepID=UPI001E36F20B|nr:MULTISPECIES: ABC transporter permease [unclassified Brevibacterium]MCD1286161.1 ABC transporter permease [Brevibacterium sp. CCUG 69071]MDK8433520.1 ABC transporter permease [Brevibacterium sp. H-BE7]
MTTPIVTNTDKNTQGLDPEFQASNNRTWWLLRSILSTPLGLIGSIMVAIVLVIGVFAPLIAPYGFAQTNFEVPFQVPGTIGYVFGTDDLGRDILSRLAFGVRASLQVGLLAVALAVVVGTPLGLLAGYFRGLDSIISRLTDVTLAFPFLIIAVGLAAISGPSLSNAAIALGISQVPTMIRVVRGETMRLKSADFVNAAIATDASKARILGMHILPNAASAIIVQATVIIPTAVIGESMLSFLGLGIQPPSPSLGIMLSDAQQYIFRAPSTALFPGLAILFICLAFNLFGDALRDALDPNSKKGH